MKIRYVGPRELYWHHDSAGRWRKIIKGWQNWTRVTIEESKALLALCRAGKLYDVARWITSRKSICTPPSIKKTPPLAAVDSGFHSLLQLLVRNEPRQEQKGRALAEAVENKRMDMVEVLVEY